MSSPITHFPSSKASAQSPNFIASPVCVSPVACVSASNLILSVVKFKESSNWAMFGNDLFLLGGFLGVRNEFLLAKRGMGLWESRRNSIIDSLLISLHSDHPLL